MKKILAVILCVALMTVVVGCQGADGTTFGATYWDDSPSQDITTIDETLRYKVSSVSYEDAKDFAPEKTQSQTLSFKVDEEKSSFELRLKSLPDKSGYVCTSTLIVFGEYTYAGGLTYKIENDIVSTEVEFKGIADKFAPVKSTKISSTTTPKNVSPSSEEDFEKIEYRSVITYGKTANIDIQPSDNSLSAFSGVNLSGEIKKYNKKKNYVDNETILEVFRTFKYDADTTSFSYQFYTVDALFGTLTPMTATGKGFSELSHVCDYFGNGESERKYTAYRVDFQTSGSFGQSFMTVYYATAIKGIEKSTYNRPVRIYQNGIYGTGYLIFDLTYASK